MTIRAGVIGYPITHSLSPYIHGYWLNQYGIDGSYDAIEVKPEHLESFLRSLPEQGFAGVNITLPHKEKALEIVQHIDPFARAVGAVNTVMVRDGQLYATNTDFVGFARNILQSAPQFDVTKGSALILGAGGAGRAVLFALMSMKVPHIYITNRTKERAEALRDFMTSSDYGYKKDQIEVLDWDNYTKKLNEVNIVVNSSSMGMTGQTGLEINLDNLPVSALVTDIVYNPLKTDLLKQAEARGNIVVDGLGMLLHQAVPGFEAWFGEKPEVTEELRRTVLQGLQ